MLRQRIHSGLAPALIFLILAWLGWSLPSGMQVYPVMAQAATTAREALPQTPRAVDVAPPPTIVPALAIGPCSLIQSDFMAGGHGNFEAVVLEGHNLVHYFHVNDDISKPWSRAQIITRQATRPGCIIQSDFTAGGHGNFEVVVPEGSNLVHYFHVNDNLLSPWQRGQVISSHASGPGCIIQSDFMAGGHGNFEVVLLEGHNLVHYFHVNDDVNSPWQRGQVISTQASGPGCLIQSDYKGGEHGNFEVVVPEGSNLVHYFHINTDINLPWQRGPVITVQATGPGSLIQSDFSANGHGNLEVVVPEGSNLVHYFFTDTGSGPAWSRGQVVTAQASGPGVILQSDFMAGGHGNFEVLVLVADPAQCHTAAPCIRHHFHINDDVNSPWQAGQVVTYTGKSQRVCQLTGEDDREWGYKTVNNTTAFGVWGTDLGQPVVHDGKIYYFFGDTITTRNPDNWNHDAYAQSIDTTPEDCLQLDFFKDGNWFHPLTIPTVSLEAFETPTGGFSANGKLYIFAATGYDGQRHARSVLARSTDDGISFQAVDDISYNLFINVSPVVVANASIPGFANQPGAGVLLFASGAYRHSQVYLAYLPLSAVDNHPRQALRYFAGLSAGQPTWSSSEAAAAPLMDQACVGELSVVWNGYLRRWLMLYNCDVPRGINYRAAAQPWGPWSKAGVIFDPRADGGYCHFIHAGDGENCDRVSDPARETTYGGEYGPYVIAPLTTGDTDSTTIYYTMSTWNPYNVMLMRATLQVERFSFPDRIVFDDRLSSVWKNLSLHSHVQFDNTAFVHDGANSVAVTFDAPSAAFSLGASEAISTAGTAALAFWIYGAPGGTPLRLLTETSAGRDGAAAQSGFDLDAPGETWTYVHIPLSALGNPATIARLTWQDRGGTQPSTFYLDDVRLVGTEAAPTPAQESLYLPLLRRR